MSYLFSDSPILTAVTQAATIPVASAPIFLKRQRKALSATASFDVPGAGQDLDLESLIVNVTATGQAGTSPTLTTIVQGAVDILDNNTTLTAVVATGDTTLTLTSRTGIPQYGYLMIMAADFSKYEWVKATSSAATGAGTTTITRAQFGTAANTFAVGDYVFFTNSWVTIPSASSGTTTLTTGAVDISTAAAAVGVTATISTMALGMSGIDYPIIRVQTVVGGSSTPTATYSISLAGKLRSTAANFK